MKQILTLLFLFATTALLAQTYKREYAYYNQANHFFDNIDFSDKQILDTPILEQKMGFYFRQMVPPATTRLAKRNEWFSGSRL